MRKMIRTQGTIVLFLLAGNVFGQAFNPHSKGHMYFYWGWNRALYTNSTISLKGDDYNLVLHKVKAHDRPTLPVNYHNYLQPDRLTIPQNNWRIGYFIQDNLAVSFGTDHMKYVMDNWQSAYVFGAVSRPGNFAGNYAGLTLLSEDFLTFEHTDGLNYVNLELEKFIPVAATRNRKLIISTLFGGGGGILLPKTNVKLMDYARNDRFHVSGYGVALKAGVEAVFFKRLILRFEAKQGFIDMPDIILHEKGVNGRGRQKFFFSEFDGVLGWSFMAGKRERKK